MEDNFYFIELYEIYKNLLTAKQQDIFSLHFLFDLSLSEIAEEKKITRQNVSDTIKNAKERLFEYERLLKINTTNKNLKSFAKELDDKNSQKLLEIIGK